MTVNDKNLRQFYIDGQLTGDGKIEFEKQLSDNQRKEIKAERNFDELIVESIKLNQDKCPDKLWEDIKSNLEDKSIAVTSAIIIPILKKPLVYAGCVVVLFALIFTFVVPRRTVAKPIEIKVDFPQDIKAFTEQAVIKGNQQDIQKTLNGEGFNIDISDIQESNRIHSHFVQIVGFSSVEIDGVKYPCAHLYFTCCGQPVSTYIIDKSRKSQEYKFSSSLPQIKRSDKTINNYRIVTFSPHHTDTVSELFCPIEK